MVGEEAIFGVREDQLSDDDSESSEDEAAMVDVAVETGKNVEGQVYNSQLFNYDMIVDLIDEVQEEISASDCQLLLLENKLRDLQVRYVRAENNGRRAAADSFKHQIDTVEGVRCMYAKYNARKREKMERLRSYSL